MRPVAAIALLALLLLWEHLAPRRTHAKPSWRRLDNLGLGVFNALGLRLLAPLGLVGVALWAESTSVGLANVYEPAPWWRWPAEVVALDLAIYWQHRILHRAPWLWRLHRTHHLDEHLDATSGLRFHPLEILLSWGFKALIIVTLGVSPVGVIAFELALNLCALFTHANVRVPGDRLLRKLLVTPDMHRIHHSQRADEHNSNYSNTLSVWDRIFRTYTADGASDQVSMPLGLRHRSGGGSRPALLRLLADPVSR